MDCSCEIVFEFYINGEQWMPAITLPVMYGCVFEYADGMCGMGCAKLNLPFPREPVREKDYHLSSPLTFIYFLKIDSYGKYLHC